MKNALPDLFDALDLGYKVSYTCSSASSMKKGLVPDVATYIRKVDEGESEAVVMVSAASGARCGPNSVELQLFIDDEPWMSPVGYVSSFFILKFLELSVEAQKYMIQEMLTGEHEGLDTYHD